MNLADILDVFSPTEPTVQITGALLDELNRLPPGQCLQITGRDGRSFVIIDSEDFTRVAAIGGMRLQSQSEASQS